MYNTLLNRSVFKRNFFQGNDLFDKIIKNNLS